MLALPAFLLFLFHASSFASPLHTPRQSSVRISTPLGQAKGVLDRSGAARFPVRYASASRWAQSTPADRWQLPNGSDNVTAMPLPCPQADPSIPATEDCLSMVLYVPMYKTGLATMVWIHGGSFILGSASAPGLDGSALALATNSIVAVMQYRLGALGFMSPNGQSNLAVQDAVSALTFLKRVVPSFGGDVSKVTVAGQSSGAKLVRALLAAPSANSLFRSAILQSEVMNYGFLATSVKEQFQDYFNSKINCASSDQSCLNGLSVPTIIQAQMDLFNNAASLNRAAGPEPMRPVRDSSFIASSLDASAAPFPSVSKRLLITTVLNDAGPAIYNFFPDPLPESLWQPIVDGSLGPTRGPAVRGSPYYPVTPDLSNDIRPLLEKLGTDQQWKCSSWTFARNWVSHGGSAYVGVFNVGALYETNIGVPFCSAAGHVCHEGDIKIVFGTVPNPNRAQKAFIAEIQRRYSAFLHNGNPNPSSVNQPSLPRWEPATASNVHPLNLGASGEAPVGACTPSFWGQQVPYDYQI